MAQAERTPTYSIDVEYDQDSPPLTVGQIAYEIPAAEYRLVFKYHGRPVLTFKGTGMDVEAPGLGVLSEMIERANASAEGRSPSFAP